MGKEFQPGCFVGCNGGQPGDGTDLRAGEMAHPGPVSGFSIAEFTYPILPVHEGGAIGPIHCRSITVYACRREALPRLFGSHAVRQHLSLDVGPDYNGKLRAIDVANYCTRSVR